MKRDVIIHVCCLKVKWDEINAENHLLLAWSAGLVVIAPGEGGYWALLTIERRVPVLFNFDVEKQHLAVQLTITD